MKFIEITSINIDDGLMSNNFPKTEKISNCTKLIYQKANGKGKYSVLSKLLYKKVQNIYQKISRYFFNNCCSC